MRKPGEMRMAAGEREAVVDLGRLLERVLRRSAGNDEYRLVIRGEHQTDSPSSVVDIAPRGKFLREVSRNEG